jgi:hypothetical protein
MLNGKFVFPNTRIDTYILKELLSGDQYYTHEYSPFSYRYEVQKHPFKDEVYNLRIELYCGSKEYPRRKELKFDSDVFVISFNTELESLLEESITEKIMNFLTFNNQLSKDELYKIFYKFEKKIIHSNNIDDIRDYFAIIKLR